MASAPSPAADHFAAFEAEVAEDKRLSEGQRRLMGLTARRERARFFDKSELMQIYICNVLRAQVEVMALGGPKRIVAIDVFNRTFDGANRIARRFGHGGGRQVEPGDPGPARRPIPTRHEPVRYDRDEIEQDGGDPAGTEEGAA